MNKTQGVLQSNKGRQIFGQISAHKGYGGCVNEVSSLRKINLSTFHSSIHLCMYHILILSTYQMAGSAVRVRNTELNESQLLPSRNPDK